MNTYNQILEICSKHVKFFQGKQFEKFTIERLSGLSNFTYKVQYDNKQSVLYKQYSDYFKIFNDRYKENIISNHLSKNQLGPSILFQDNLDRIDEFLPYQSISRMKLSEDTYLQKTAKLLAKFHNCMPYSEQFDNSFLQKLEKQGLKQELERCCKLIQDKNLQDWVSNILSQVFDHKQGSNEKSIYELVKIQYNDIQSPLVFAHNDLNSTNILVDQQNELHLIDFEHTGFNKRAFEFGNFFNEMIMDYEIPEPPYFKPHEDQYLSLNRRKSFFAQYLCYQNQLDIDENNATYENIYIQLKKQDLNIWLQENVNKLINEAEQGRILSHFQWFMVGILSFQYQDLQLDLKAYTQYRYDEILKSLEQSKLLQSKL